MKPKKESASPTFRVVAQLADGTSLNKPVTGSPAVVTDSGKQVVVVTDALGQSTATGNESFAIAGLGGTARANAGLAYVLGFSPSATPSGGQAFCGSRGVAITGEGGAANTGTSGIAAALQNGNAIVQGCGVAIAINTRGSFVATATAYLGSVLVLGYVNASGKLAFSMTKVDGKQIKEGKAYRVKDKSGKIVPA